MQIQSSVVGKNCCLCTPEGQWRSTATFQVIGSDHSDFIDPHRTLEVNSYNMFIESESLKIFTEIHGADNKGEACRG